MLDEPLPATRSATRDPASSARRQPGWRRYPLAELLTLPRREANSSRQRLFADQDDQDPDHLKPFTGIIVAVGLSVPIWLTIAGLLYYLI
jgi:hypothetical protein